MTIFGFSNEYNKIQGPKTFNVTALITAYCFDRNPNRTPYWEKYDFSQIFLILEGRGSYTTEDGTYPLEPGMMFYRPANRQSSYSLEDGNARFALISFVCDSPAMKDFGEKPIRLHEEEIITLLDVIQTTERISEPLKENEPVMGIQIKRDVPDAVLSFIYSSLERFLAMVYCRLKNIHLLLDESQKSTNHADESRLALEIKKYLSDHISEQLTMNDICIHFCASQTALTKKFRKETNQGIMEYFTDLKISEAKKRIQRGEESVTKIAEALGFSTVNYFSKVFKDKTGMTPTEYSRFVSKRQYFGCY